VGYYCLASLRRGTAELQNRGRQMFQDWRR